MSYLETNFGGKHKEISIPDVHVVVLANTSPDLSVLSVDRWRLWRLGGQEFNDIIWPCKISPILKDYNKLLKMVVWCVKLTNYSPNEIFNLDQYKGINIPEEWDSIYSKKDPNKSFLFSNQFTRDLNSLPSETPNYVRGLLHRFLKNIADKDVISFS